MKYVPVWALSKENREACYAVRYAVYVEEKGFEPPNDSGLESDALDEMALHIGIRSLRDAHNTIRGDIVGTVRIIPYGSVGEISRFCILAEHRCPGAVQQLIDALRFASEGWHLTHWVALMEPRLFRLLSKYGVQFTPIGPLLDYRGKRQFGIYEL